MSRFSQFILLPILFLILINPSQIVGQEIVNVEFRGEVGKILIELNLARLGVNIAVENDVEVYKVNYTTRDVTGGVDTASGLMVIPVFRDKTMPIAVYDHGTIGSREDAPSRFSLTNQNEAQIALLYGSFGYATLAPDYIGLGDSPGFHPYVHAESEAWATIDMITAFKKYAEQESIPLNDQLFISGYSQGGHAAMATHKVLQRDFKDIHPVTASTPMSGPYNIYGGMVDFTLSDLEYELVAYVAYVALSYSMMYPDLPQLDMLDSFFKQSYVDDILSFRNEEINLWELNARLVNTLVAEHGRSIPRFMLQDSVVDIIANQPDHPISQAIIDNNLYDWVPEAPVRMYYCKADEQVFFENATFTDSIMNANGAVDVAAINLGDDLDHGGCVIPAIQSSIEFFNSLRDITSDVTDVELEEIANIYPNPVGDQLYISDKGADILHATIYDLKGSRVYQDISPSSRIDVSSLQPGMYILQLQTQDKSATSLLVKE